jgi:hypothetical protein
MGWRLAIHRQPLCTFLDSTTIAGRAKSSWRSIDRRTLSFSSVLRYLIVHMWAKASPKRDQIISAKSNRNAWSYSLKLPLVDQSVSSGPSPSCELCCFALLYSSGLVLDISPLVSNRKISFLSGGDQRARIHQISRLMRVLCLTSKKLLIFADLWHIYSSKNAPFSHFSHIPFSLIFGRFFTYLHMLWRILGRWNLIINRSASCLPLSKRCLCIDILPQNFLKSSNFPCFIRSLDER